MIVIEMVKVIPKYIWTALLNIIFTLILNLDIDFDMVKLIKL